MGIFKRVVPPFLTVILLCACSAVPSQDGTAIRSNANEDAGVESQDQTAGNPIHLCNSSTDQGYYESNIYFENGANITYVDYQTKREIFLCGNPNCSHADEICNSFYPFDGETQLSGVQLAGNHLLAIQAVVSDGSLPHINLLTPEGTFQKRLVEFESSQKLPGNISNGYYTDDESLYFVMTEIDEDTSQSAQYIVSTSLTDGTVKTIYRPSDEVIYLALCGSYDRCLIFRQTVINKAGMTIDSYGAVDVDSCQWEELPYHGTDDVGYEVRGSNVYEMNFSSCDITIYDLATGQSRKANFSKLNSEIVEKYGDKIANYVLPLTFTTDICLVEYAILGGESDTTRLDYTLNLSTGETEQFTLYKEFNHDIMQVVAQTPGKLLVQTDWDSHQSNGYEVYLPTWILIEPEDYLHSNLKGDEIEILEIR